MVEVDLGALAADWCTAMAPVSQDGFHGFDDLHFRHDGMPPGCEHLAATVEGLRTSVTG